MSDAFPNHIREGMPWSSDVLPAGPDPVGMDTYRRRVSQDSPVTLADEGMPLLPPDRYNDLYAGLPDIAVPKHKVS